MNKNTHEKYDVCIIGAGSAGLSVAAGISQLGMKTALIEKSDMGGDCLNTGCVPSKALLQAAKAAEAFRKSGHFGIKKAEPEIDFNAVKDHVFDVISTIEPNDSQERFESLGVHVIREAASFLDPHTVLAGTQKIRSKYFVIATGSRAFVPPIPGLDPQKIFTNENIFSLRERPEHLIIIGGGPIGIEMAQAHRRLGSKVTLLEIAKIMPKDDPELVDILRNHLQEEGIYMHENVQITKIAHQEGTSSVFLSHGSSSIEIEGTHILVSTGRIPNVDKLDLEKAHVRFGKRGIEVDKRLRTTNKHIYAAGDVAGGPQFTHVAAYHAGIIIRNIAFKLPAKVDYSALPWVTYTDPELANVGLTEAMATEKFGDNKVITTSWHMRENDRAQAERKTTGMIKIVALKNGRILGASIIAPNAGEMLGMWSIAIQKQLKLSDVAAVMAPYPTMSEAGKRAAGAWYTPKLFSEKTKALVRFLNKLPI